MHPEYVFDPSRPQDQRRYERLSRINDFAITVGWIAFVVLFAVVVTLALVLEGETAWRSALTWAILVWLVLSAMVVTIYFLTRVKPDRSYMVDRWHLRSYVDVPTNPVVEWEVATRERAAAEMMDVASQRYMGKHLTQSEVQDYDSTKDEVAAERDLIARYVQEAREKELAGS